MAESYRGLGIALLESRRLSYCDKGIFQEPLNLDASNANFWKRDVQCYLASARSQYGENDGTIEVYTEILINTKNHSFTTILEVSANWMRRIMMPQELILSRH